jgi:hypothetical protein
MRRKLFITSGACGMVTLLLTISGYAQPNLQAERDLAQGAGDGYYFYIFLIVLSIAAGLAALWKVRSSKNAEPEPRYEDRHVSRSTNSYDARGVDATQEMEWLRQAKHARPNVPKISYGKKQPPEIAPTRAEAKEEETLDAKLFQERMRRLQYTQLPINSFSQLAPAKKYQPLPDSDDEGLLTAIEQINDEYEEDEAVRDLAVRVLSMFRTGNAIEALSQVALYDLSANLRSKAVTTLTEFDHESVFEPILLACADPTREVRAAAARGLFRLSFDRAHAWKSLIETDDVFRMSHAARAASEAGIVTKSLDRLIHPDVKVAYEAFALVVLLIKAGEIDEIFDALENHRDQRVKFALLHVLKVVKDERTLSRLTDFRLANSFPTDMADRLREVVQSFDRVAA